MAHGFGSFWRGSSGFLRLPRCVRWVRLVVGWVRYVGETKRILWDGMAFSNELSSKMTRPSPPCEDKLVGVVPGISMMLRRTKN